ncbi:unnamed protein product [Allacma fusca]|uniref:Uncharacterized protein n=1 Tax=Allacma fusca TaxID=39272 RepID=A0A8J2P5B1_9HEXA|nr:unnamed protein product [Allacma fusca]
MVSLVMRSYLNLFQSIMECTGRKSRFNSNFLKPLNAALAFIPFLDQNFETLGELLEGKFKGNLQDLKIHQTLTFKRKIVLVFIWRRRKRRKGM